MITLNYSWLFEKVDYRLGVRALVLALIIAIIV
uniref:Truncated vpu protein n=1 Tax=Human immunodeficiency virus type 1 TaxID=11676 RepID=A0A0H3Y993_HV1|nr:truncated vpu protein [Human immunodeficiency virus 1]